MKIDIAKTGFYLSVFILLLFLCYSATNMVPLIFTAGTALNTTFASTGLGMLFSTSILGVILAVFVFGGGLYILYKIYK